MYRRVLAVILTLILTIASVSQIAFAEETSAELNTKVEFKISEPDKDGYAVASFTLFNTPLNGVQFGITFDKDVMQFADMETHDVSDDFSKVRKLYPFENENGIHKFVEAEVLNSVSNENGTLNFGCYGMPDEVTDEAGVVTIGEDGFLLYEFGVKFLKEEDPKIGFADYESAVFEKEAIISAADLQIEFDFEVILPESFGADNQVIAVIPKEPEKSLKQLRQERLVDSLILNIDNYASVDDGLLKWVDPSNKEVVPFIGADSRTYVPLRFIGEAFGAEVIWTPETKEVKVLLGDITVIMHIDENTYTKNDEELTMDAAPVIVNDRTFVPARYISEALDKAVYWDASARLVIITPQNAPWVPEGVAERSILPDALILMSSLVRDLQQ